MKISNLSNRLKYTAHKEKQLINIQKQLRWLLYKRGEEGEREHALQRGKNCSDNDTTEIKNDI